MHSNAVREVLELLPYGVFVATATVNGGIAAIVVTWCMQVSFLPPLIALSLEQNGAFLGHVVEAGTFAVNLLGKNGKPTAREILRHRGVFPNGAEIFVQEPGTAPALAGALATLWCRVHRTLEAGDHVVLLGAVERGEHLRRGQLLTLADTGWKYRAATDNDSQT